MMQTAGSSSSGGGVCKCTKHTLDDNVGTSLCIDCPYVYQVRNFLGFATSLQSNSVNKQSTTGHMVSRRLTLVSLSFDTLTNLPPPIVYTGKCGKNSGLETYLFIFAVYCCWPGLHHCPSFNEVHSKNYTGRENLDLNFRL